MIVARWPTLALTVLALAGCGKVGDPLPPLTTLPETAEDLTVRQIGTELVFSWTNPSRSVDGSAVGDLDQVVVRADGQIVGEFPVTGAGRTQTLRRTPSELTGTPREYTLEFVTRDGRRSPQSDPVVAAAVEVPGPVSGLRARVDQRRIALEWSAPAVHPELVASYRVYRAGVLVGQTPTMEFEDPDYVEGEAYGYTIAAVRAGEPPAEGLRSVELVVEAVDTTPPGPPTGLRVTILGTSALLVWQPNPELDVARYRVLGRRSADGEFSPLGGEPRAATQFTDPDFEPGSEYAVTAIDRSGNESAMSPLVRP